MQKSIQTRLAVIITVLIAISVLSISYLAYNKTRTMLVDYTRERLITDAAIYSDMVDKYIFERSKDIAIMAKHPVLINMNTTGAEKSAVLKNYKEDYGCYASISMTDASGMQVADSEGTVGVMKNDLEWFQAAVKGNLYISDVRMSRDLNKPVLNFACPVKDGSGNIIGTLTSRLILESTIWTMVDEFQQMQEKHGKVGYAFIIDKSGVIMAHPNREMVLNQNILEMGISELKAAGEKMIRGESGFSRYQYEDVDKYVAYVPLDGWGEYRGQGWSIGLTSPVTDFLIPVYIMRKFMVTLGLAVALIGLGLTLLFARSIVRPIKTLLANVQEVAKGNLTRSVDVRSKDEIGELGSAFNQMVSQLRVIVANLQGTSIKLSSHSQEMAASGEEVSATVEELAGTTNEVAATINHSAENSRAAQEESIHMREIAGDGDLAIQQALKKINSIAENSKLIAGAVHNLGKQSGKIGEIISTITGIADQTNLLALNAAIEAARAGEHGRGFAVVADEVRQLAEQSGRAANEITGLVKQIQTGVGEATMMMDKGLVEVNEGVEMANSAGMALNKITAAIDKNAETISDLAIGADQINEGAQQLSAAIQQISSTIQQVSGAALDLAGIAAALEQAAAKFIVEK